MARATKAELIRELEEERAVSEARALRNMDLTERMAEIELGLEDIGWLRQSMESDREMSREGLRRIAALSRLYFIKNPLIKRAVLTQAYYVFGQGVSFEARHASVDEMIQRFVADKGNARELFSHEARTLKEEELQVEGNLFFVLFTDIATGHVRVRTIPTAEITDIHTDPDDKRSPWYYRREWSQESFDQSTGNVKLERVKRYYPDMDFQPDGGIPDNIGGTDVAKERVLHVKVGGLGDMRFGVSEVYAALDWAAAYKTFLENWATIQKALSRFAAKLSVPSASGVTTAGDKLGSRAPGNGGNETNPAPATASNLVGPKDVTWEPIKTAGVATGPEEGRRLMLMVAAAVGLPETYFGDVSIGNYATAIAMDRPTELKFRDRQELWRSIFGRIFDFAIEQSVQAPDGLLQGTIRTDADGYTQVDLVPGESDNEDEISCEVNVTFPSILEHDLKPYVDAAIAAKTANGLPEEEFVRLILGAFNFEHIDEIIDMMFPKDENGNPIEDEPTAPETEIDPATQLAQAAAAMQGAIESIKESQ